MWLHSRLASLARALWLSAVCLAGLSRPAMPACSLTSPAHRVALIELYTSEGCSSCPPADRWLSSLAGNGFGPERVVALAMHVDYWNDLGWADRFSQDGFSQRQREAAHRGRHAVIYTPQVVLDGKDLPAWSNAGQLASSVAKVNSALSAVDIHARISPVGTTLQIDGEVRGLESVRHEAIGAWAAVYENHLVTRVSAGENGGRTLEHDYVVRALLGPIPFGRDGIAKLNLRLPIEAEWNRSMLGVAVFVQDAISGTVLQAVSATDCL